MFVHFENYIRRQISLSADELQQMRATATEYKLKRREYILKAGDICRYKIFVISGMLRSYRTKPDGSEHILKFSPEESWTTDPESYHHLTPSHYYIDALEDSELIMWAKADFDDLFNKIPALEGLTQRLISNNLYSTQQRVFSSISSTAEEKYDEFVQTYPGILARVPLHMVASYLGVSRETLSRIRHAQVRR